MRHLLRPRRHLLRPRRHLLRPRLLFGCPHRGQAPRTSPERSRGGRPPTRWTCASVEAPGPADFPDRHHPTLGSRFAILILGLATLFAGACSPEVGEGGPDASLEGGSKPHDTGRNGAEANDLLLRVDGWNVERLAPGAFALLQPSDERFDEANSLVAFGSQSLLVVDACSNEQRVRSLLTALEPFGDRDVFLVNTHWHGDHVQGNALFREALGDRLTILGHATHAADISGRAAAAHRERVSQLEEQIPLARERLDHGEGLSGQKLSAEAMEAQRESIDRAERWLLANRDQSFVGPDRTFEGSLELDLGQRRVMLRAFRAHTRGDVVIHLPDDGILASGDLLDDLPYVGHGYPTTWIEALDRIEALAPDTIVPGHGSVYPDLEQLEEVRGYLGALVEEARSAAAAGMSDEELTSSADLTEWRDRLAADDLAGRFFDQTIEEALLRTARDLRGELAEED